MSNTWLERTPLHDKYPSNHVWGNSRSDISTTLAPGQRELIEAEVIAWLLEPDGGPALSLYLVEADGSRAMNGQIVFDRSEIFIKTCSNCWNHWKIAEASNWPSIISIPMQSMGMNDYQVGMTAPNEIHTDNYA